METNCYNDVEIDEVKEHNNASWKPLMRQLFVFSGVTSIYFVLGLSFGAPTVFIPQLRKDTNFTETLSDDVASWLSSVHGYSAIPWVIFMPILSSFVGRKIPFLIVCLNSTVGTIVFYFSTNAMQLLISEIMQGMLLASNITLLIVIVTEYTSSRYRGFLLAILQPVFFWGIWVANITGTFFHWKNIGAIAFVCALYSFTALVWPESPSWLAMKGRFDESASAHHWLKGFDKDSEKELVNLINTQKEYFRVCAQRKRRSYCDRLRSVVDTMSKEAFYKPLVLCMTALSLYHFSGKMVCGMYAVELIKQITADEVSAYVGMLIVDSVTLIGMQIGCALVKIVKRKSLLLVSSIIGMTFLLILSLYLHLISLNLMSENKFVTIAFLTCFSMFISSGIMILPACFLGELVFLRYKSLTLLVITLYSELLMATMLKISPYIFKIFTLQGTFLFYSICASSLLVILYVYLPETKDKTTVEIEAFFEKSHKSDRAAKKFIDDEENIDWSQRDELCK